MYQAVNNIKSFGFLKNVFFDKTKKKKWLYLMKKNIFNSFNLKERRPVSELNSEKLIIQINYPLL